MKRLHVSTLVVAMAFATACPKCSPSTPDPSRSTVAVDRPTGAVADGVDRVQITVTVRDTAGDPVAGVVVQLAASGTGNTLVQPAGPTDASGVATGTLATTVAESKTISASIPQGPIPSTATAVFGPGPASRLGFTTQPADAMAGQSISPPPAVAVLDAAGNTVASATTTITVGLTGGAAGAVLSGAPAQSASSGVAVFPGLSVDRAGTGYRLTATAPGLSGATSDAFTVTSSGVVGTRIIHFVAQDGVSITDVPDDLSGATITAYVAGDGGYAVYPGVGTDAGTFQISGVPSGTYLLRFGPFYFETSARTVDLGYHQGGRADVERNTPGTYQRTQVTGLAPWTTAGEIESDALQMTSAGANFYIWSLDQDALDGGAARPGDTSIDQLMTYDMFGYDIPLVDGTKGDVTYLDQLQFRDAGVIFGGGGQVVATNRSWSLVRSSGPLSVKLDAGQTSLVSAAMAPAPQVSLPLDWKISPSTAGSFGSYRAAVSPSASTFVRYQLLVDAIPSSAYGSYVSSPDLALLTVNDDVTINQPDPQLTLQYGDPFPAGWARFGYAEAAFGMSYQFSTDAGSYGAGTSVFISGSDLMGSFSTAPLVPRVTPVTSPRIDGVSFFSDQTLASATPTIQWSPPAVGTPTYYWVAIHRMDGPGGSSHLYTAGTQLKVPPGTFVSGGYYYVIIEAVVSPSTSIQSAPFEQHWPRHAADSASGVIHVP